MKFHVKHFLGLVVYSLEALTYLLLMYLPSFSPLLFSDVGIPEDYWKMGMLVTSIPCCVVVVILFKLFRSIHIWSK